MCKFKPPLNDHAEKYSETSVVVDSLLIVIPIAGFCNCSTFCCTLLYINSSFSIILMGKRELVALLGSWCLVIVVWLFLTVPWVCLHFVIVVFPDHIHYFWDLNFGQSLHLHPYFVYVSSQANAISTKISCADLHIRV